MIAHVDIESAFDSIIGSCGGIRVDNIVGPSPPFRNADYLFHEHRVVAELKCLEEDKTHDPNLAEKLGRIWIKWRQKGFVSGKTPSRIDWRTLPKNCQMDMYKIVGKPIQKKIQKANIQIRETKAALNLGDYTGLLLIANDGNFAMSPAAVIHCIQSNLAKDFREIHNFVFFTANMTSRMAGTPIPVLFWIPFSMSDEHKLSEDFMNNLYRAWVLRHEELTGIPNVQSDQMDMEAFWNANY
jgi:hypothetical protein